MHFILIIWLAIGSTDIRTYPTETACRKDLDTLTRSYEVNYVIRSAGCFPDRVIAQAAAGSRQ